MLCEAGGAGHPITGSDLRVRSGRFSLGVLGRLGAARARFDYPADGLLHPFVQPPAVAALLAPLAERIDYPAFRDMMRHLELAAFAAAICVAYAAWRPMRSRLLHFVLCLTLLSASYPFVSSMLLAQTQPVIILLTLIAIERDLKEKPAAAALALALATALKVSPALFAVYWLIFGRWRTLGLFTIFLCIYAGLTVALIDATLIETFAGRMRDLGAQVIVGFENVSLQSFLYHFGEGGDFGYLIESRPGWIGLFSQIFLALVVAAAWWRARWASETWRVRAAAPAIVIAGIVAAPLSWNHYYSFVIIYAPTMLALWPGWRGVAFMVAIVSLCSALAPAIWLFGEEGSQPLVFLTLGAGLLSVAAALSAPRPTAPRRADRGLPPAAAEL